MRHTSLAALAAVALSACSGDDSDATFLAACEGSGSSPDVCSCELEKARAELSDYTFAVVVEAAKLTDGAESVRYLTENLSQDQQTEYFQSRMRWIVECGGQSIDVVDG